MTIPLSIFLAAYGVFFLICCIFVFFNFYHIARFGLQGLKTTLVLALYTVAFGVLIFFQLDLLLTIDWTQSLSIRDAFLSTTPSF